MDITVTNDFKNYINEKYNFNSEPQKQTNNNIKETSLTTLKPATITDILPTEVIFYFDIIKSHRIQLQSQITDYWLEDNTAVQDSINIQPVIVTLSGLVGEVVYTPPHTFTDKIIDKLNNMFPSKTGFTLTQKLGAISSLVPSVDNYTQMAKNAIDYTEVAYNHYKKIFDQVANWKKGQIANTQTRQEQVFQNLKMLWLNKVNLIVSTPYQTFTDMYIQNIEMEQEETTTVSNLTITLKQLKFKETATTNADKKVLEQYAQYAQAKVEDNGQSKSILGSILNYYNNNNINVKHRVPGEK